MQDLRPAVRRSGPSDFAHLLSAHWWLPALAADGGCRSRAPHRAEKSRAARRRRRHLSAALRARRLAAAAHAQSILPRPVPCRRLACRHRAAVRSMTRHLVIFARAPQPGRVKRRLAREVGALDSDALLPRDPRQTDRHNVTRPALDRLAVRHARQRDRPSCLARRGPITSRAAARIWRSRATHAGTIPTCSRLARSCLSAAISQPCVRPILPKPSAFSAGTTWCSARQAMAASG